MNLPNALSFSRIILAPIFFVLYMVPEWTGQGHALIWILLMLLYLAAEISDIADGMIARKLKLVSPLGKVLDPLSDVITHVTFFFCLNQTGLLLNWLFYCMILRELGIILIRMVLLIEGTALAAARGGKIKSVFYALASGFGLLATGGLWFKLQDQWQQYLFWVTNSLMAIGVLIGIISFFQYFQGYRKRAR